MTTYTNTDLSPASYLTMYDGDLEKFSKSKKTLPLGQAFFDSLNENDQWILQHSGKNIRTSDDKNVVRDAIKTLLEFGI